MDTLQHALANPLVRGFVTGLIVAAWADFRTWKSYEDAKFNFKVASWRWLQGAIGGIFAGGGLGAIS